MKTVFVVQHLHDLPSGKEDVKLIGVYSSRAMAESAVARLVAQPGFRKYPKLISGDDPEEEGFYIGEYHLDVDYWPEGFVTVLPNGEELSE